MQVDCITEPSVFGDLATEWEALLARSVTETTFLRPYWQKAWWLAYQAGKELRLLTARKEDGELVGVAPLFLHEMFVDPTTALPPLSIERPFVPEGRVGRRILHPVGGSEISDYLDWIVAREGAPSIYQALWSYLVGNAADWDLLDLHCIPEGSPTLTEVPQLARSSGLSVSVEREEVCPIINLQDSWDGYLATLNKKQRHEIRRKGRKAHREVQVEWRKAVDGGVLEEDIALFFQLHQASAPDKAAFWDDATRQFFRDIAWALHNKGKLELSFMYYNGEPVASLFCFREGDAILVYNSGYEPSRYRSLSSGLVLLSQVIEDAIERGIRVFDFLRGDERYKYDFGGVNKAIYRLGVSST